jgi:hypothetical protein
MIYRGPSVRSTGDTQKAEKERQHADGRGCGDGTELFDRKRAWSSINHRILSGQEHMEIEEVGITKLNSCVYEAQVCEADPCQMSGPCTILQ